MPLPSTEELIALYSQARPSDIGQAENALFQAHGLEPLVPLLVEVYPHLRRSAGRAALLSWLVPYARIRQDVVSLAILALADRAGLVRERACSILAYSLRDDALPPLEALLAHADHKTRACAAAAMDAIASRHHHDYVDTEHTGDVFWGVSPGDVPG